MVNYQLYHTNVYLGGQMKYDLILEPHDENLVVSDFHISPVSPYIPFTQYENDNIFIRSHQENIQRFYSNISSDFFKSVCKPELTGKHLKITNDNTIDTHDDTYEMGCKRIQYSLYNKQFGFFIPLWLEHVSGPINFQFEIYTDKAQTSLVCVKNLVLDVENGCDYHNKFVEYIQNYFNFLGISDGSSDIINLDTSNNVAKISGLNVKTGICEVKNISNLLGDLFNIEMPLLDFDHMIISGLKNNYLISKQLHNFNLCFNLEDILTRNIKNLLNGRPLYIKVRVKVGDEILDIKDFYTNYEYIPKTYCGVSTELTLISDINSIDFEENDMTPQDLPNVLDYLQDYNYIEHVSTNKLNQPIIHWSLIEDNDYIVNAYGGFGGVYKDKDGELIPIDYIYGNTPDITSNISKPSSNTNTWCNIVNVDMSGKEASVILPYLGQFIPYSTTFGYNKLIRGIRYNNDGTYRDSSLIFIQLRNYRETDNAKYGLNDIKEKIGTFGFDYYSPEGKEFIMIYTGTNDNEEDMFIVIYEESCEDYSDYIHKNFCDIIHNWELTQSLYENISNAVDKSDTISFNTILIPTIPNGPRNISEIEYKKDNGYSKVLRLFDKIRPTFIGVNDNKFNYRYFVKKMSINDYKTSNYHKYSLTKYPPKYPSIGYFTLDKIDERYESNDLNAYKEKKAYNDSKVLCLNPTINAKIESEKINGKYTPLKDLIKTYVKNYYDINDDDTDYVLSLYNISSSFEYKNASNIEDYIYDVKIELK